MYIIKQNKFELYLQVSNATEITNVCKIDNYLWVATRSGLYQYRGKEQVNHFFKDDAVSDVFRDKEGNFWVTTLNRGVLWVPSMNVLRMLDNKKIHRLGLNGEDLWLGGTESNYYLKSKGTLTSYHLPADWADNKMTCFRFYGDKTYAGAKTGLVIMGAGTTEYFKVSVNDLLQNNGSIYIATTYTARIDVNKIAASIVHTPMTYRILHKRTNVLGADTQGNIWIGTNFGLYVYANEPRGYIMYNMGERFDELAVSIEDLYVDTAQNRILVGTASQGLVVLSDNKVTRVIKTKNGLNNNTVTAIRKTGDNTYLAGTNNGLNKITLSSGGDKVENCNLQVGVGNKRINDIEFSNDTVYLATDNGCYTSACKRHGR